MVLASGMPVMVANKKKLIRNLSTHACNNPSMGPVGFESGEENTLKQGKNAKTAKKGVHNRVHINALSELLAGLTDRPWTFRQIFMSRLFCVVVLVAVGEVNQTAKSAAA